MVRYSRVSRNPPRRFKRSFRKRSRSVFRKRRSVRRRRFGMKRMQRAVFSHVRGLYVRNEAPPTLAIMGQGGVNIAPSAGENVTIADNYPLLYGTLLSSNPTQGSAYENRIGNQIRVKNLTLDGKLYSQVDPTTYEIDPVASEPNNIDNRLYIHIVRAIKGALGDEALGLINNVGSFLYNGWNGGGGAPVLNPNSVQCLAQKRPNIDARQIGFWIQKTFIIKFPEYGLINNEDASGDYAPFIPGGANRSSTNEWIYKEFNKVLKYDVDFNSTPYNQNGLIVMINNTRQQIQWKNTTRMFFQNII